MEFDSPKMVNNIDKSMIPKSLPTMDHMDNMPTLNMTILINFDSPNPETIHSLKLT